MLLTPSKEYWFFHQAVPTSYRPEDIADGSRLDLLFWDGILSLCSGDAFFKPLDAVDKIDLKLVHNQFDGVKILPAGKAPGKIMSGIDGSVKTAAYRAGKRQLAVAAVGSYLEQGFDNVGNGKLVA